MKLRNMRRNTLTFETGADEDGPSEKVPHAALVAGPANTRIDTENPDGAVQLVWTDRAGFTHEAHLVRWWRLDRQGLGEGIEVQVAVQARQRRDLAYPPHHVAACLRVTGDADDKAQVLIGDPHRDGSWFYGVVFHGAVLISTTVQVEE